MVHTIGNLRGELKMPKDKFKKPTPDENRQKMRDIRKLWK